MSVEYPSNISSLIQSKRYIESFYPVLMPSIVHTIKKEIKSIVGWLAFFFLLFGLLGTVSMSELSKATLATGKPILVLCHEGPLAQRGQSRLVLVTLSPCSVELVDGDLAFDFAFLSTITSYHLQHSVFEVLFACLALSFCLFFIKYLLPFLPWECPQQPVVW